ncbi:hypothetical protein [Rhizobium sp. BK251]|uniref:hypothetical protein n=1 Tax=Rhizobium sp. BK251 TaxID=2512125 RepID=UPI00104CCB0F|nr:hypothetical protein [Rhizobium sp. BK251]
MAILAAGLVLLLHGAIPFFMTPTLGQAVWTSGFAQSFANGPLYSIHTHDFGLPVPSAIPFGLAGALPVSWLIRLGLHPSDAYAGMAAFWLTVAFGSAFLISRSFGATRSVSLLLAMTWMSMPIIWAHAGYSMVSLGIGLLPFYFLAALRLFELESASSVAWKVSFYLLATFVSVFMDGYSFVMFAAGSSILLGYFLLTGVESRRHLLKTALPTHIISFALAYLAYKTYIGKGEFEPSSLDFFREAGLDLSFVVIPTSGFHWFADIIGISARRTEEIYYGDASIWTTTFSLPIILAGLFAWFRVRRKRTVVSALLIIALVGFYMALGPTLKINSTRPGQVEITQSQQQGGAGAVAYGVGPTGSAWISENIPGFKSMRATYRWSALEIFALWALVAVWSGSLRRNSVAPVVVLLLIVVLNIPNLPQRFRMYTDNRAQFHQIDDDLFAKLRQSINPNEVVAFAPWRNDFMANYLAPNVGFRTFNIGGDKNLAEAQLHWPLSMLALSDNLEATKIHHIVKILRDRNADVVVIPYFHMLWSPHLWPCVDQTRATLTESAKEDWNRLPGFYCPDRRKAELQPLMQQIKQLPFLETEDGDLFATIRLRPQDAAEAGR